MPVKINGILKFFLVILLLIILVNLLLPFISSYMQSYYKAQLPSIEDNSEKIIALKNFWVQVGKPKTALFVSAVIFSVFPLTVIIKWIKNKVFKI